MTINDKYFDLKSDYRFPLEIPSEGWQSFDNLRFKTFSKTCIYLLKSGNRYYVGSDNSGERPYDHRRQFKNNCHANHYMQRVFNKRELFFYIPLVEIPFEYQKYRDQIENAYIKLFNTFNGVNKNGFNLMEFADTPTLGRKMSIWTKEKISKSKVGVKWPAKQREEACKNRGKLVKFINPDGLVIEIKNLKRFSIENGLNHSVMQKVNSGKREHCKGWRKYNEDCKTQKFNPKKFNFISPDGLLHNIEFNNLKSFCIENNLSYDCMRNVNYGNIQCHKGWTKPKE